MKEVDYKMNSNKKTLLISLFKGILILLAAIACAILITSTKSIKINLPKISAGTSLGMLFIFGLFTSIHCISMCGGLMLTQCVNNSTPKPSNVVLPPLLYNVGRILSYTIIGGIIGGIGHLLSFSPLIKGLIPLIGGCFMILMAINLLFPIPLLRHFQIGTPKFIVKKIRNNTDMSPFILGFLTGIMPCGPLQMIQMYALTTRSVIYGGLSMLLFSAGTAPSLILFGSLSSIVNKRFSKIMLNVSAVLIIILGFSMITKGLAMSGLTKVFSMNMKM